jgi:hypothetical protein
MAKKHGGHRNGPPMGRTLLHWSTHGTLAGANNEKVKHRTYCGRSLLATSITLQGSASEGVLSFSRKFSDRCKSRLSRFPSHHHTRAGERQSVLCLGRSPLVRA